MDLGSGSQSLYFNTSTNRINGSSYDAAGNLLNDGVHSYTYDAENKIRTVDGVTAYVYDGEGQRVRKLVGENTVFVYDVGGQMLMEFDGATGGLTKEYVQLGGSLATIVKASGAVMYLTSDHLGTPRVSTKADGSVAARHDYKPFGEEIFAGTGGRTTGQGYSMTDGVRQKFTSKERDTETGLDFFGARYYGSTQGRFTSADPFMGSGKTVVPQSWNRYTYCANNPLVLIDPNGLDWGYYDLGNGKRSIVWFDGAVGKYKGRQYKPLDFGNSSSMVLNLEGGSRVQIFQDGRSNPLGRNTATPPQQQQSRDTSLPGANQALIRQMAAMPLERATVTFAIASLMGAGIYASPILLLDSAAMAGMIIHMQQEADANGAMAAGTSGRAREIASGEISEAAAPDAALRYLGPGYKEVSPGRYVSADGMRQVRFGAHETRTPGNIHIHFEAYDKPASTGGRVIENSRVKITPRR